MMDPARKNGLLGEIAAARYLRDHGYTILDANFRTRQGEVDIIASKGDMLSFCEVKTRGEHAKALPRESVGADKQRRVIAAALAFVRQEQYQGRFRFDVLEVLIAPDRSAQVTMLEDAFRAEAARTFGL